MKKQIAKLQEENNQLKSQLENSKMDFVWGLTPLDYAQAKYGGSPALNQLSNNNHYSPSEINNKELIQRIKTEMKSEDIAIDNWSEVVSQMNFGEELTKLLLTLALRNE